LPPVQPLTAKLCQHSTLIHGQHPYPRGAGGLYLPWILKFLAKKVVFFVFSGKNQISPLLAPLEKFRKNPVVAATGKNPSDAHALI